VLFNSINFAIFLPVVFILYWFVLNKNYRHQNILLLVASYFFYACWDYRFLFLLVFSTMLDYFTGLKMSRAPNLKIKKFWFWLSIAVNLGFLGFFKYYNFFVTSFAEALAATGLHVDVWTLKVILPVGISFYTFHGLSYVIDIYYDRIKPEKNIIDYSVFVSFFPLLVAGPIERATHLLPQIQRERKFSSSHAIDGLRQILWGLFKKIVIADNCAEYVNIIFNNSGHYSGSTLVVGGFLFAFQIYCDFSGYSDIALGTAKLFGVDLLRNFAFPYFSRDIAEFWRRWHISLSTWFRDYLYIPLGGSKGGMWMKIRNTFVIFVVSGFWHGANWTFVIWGFLNAVYFLPLLLSGNNRNNIGIVAEGRMFPTIREFANVVLTFCLTTFAWIFFRANDVHQAMSYIRNMLKPSLFAMPEILPIFLFVLLFFFVLIEWSGREQKYALGDFGLRWPRALRWGFYYSLIVIIFLLMGKEQEFIYFQF
jgi:alginate O-acetyltransferase complex protein AlgI